MHFFIKVHVLRIFIKLNYHYRTGTGYNRALDLRCRLRLWQTQTPGAHPVGYIHKQKHLQTVRFNRSHQNPGALWDTTEAHVKCWQPITKHVAAADDSRLYTGRSAVHDNNGDTHSSSVCLSVCVLHHPVPALGSGCVRVRVKCQCIGFRLGLEFKTRNLFKNVL